MGQGAGSRGTRQARTLLLLPVTGVSSDAEGVPRGDGVHLELLLV